MRWLLLPGCIVAGWLIARIIPFAARVLSLVFPLIGGTLLAVLAITGASSGPEGLHRWTGHYYVAFFWLTLPTAVGMLLQAKLMKRPLVAIVQCGVLCCGLVLALLAGFTGYLGPSHNPNTVGETYRRFVLLHGILLPGMLAIVQLLWLWFAWPIKTPAHSPSEPPSPPSRR